MAPRIESTDPCNLARNRILLHVPCCCILKCFSNIALSGVCFPRYRNERVVFLNPFMVPLLIVVCRALKNVSISFCGLGWMIQL